MSSPRGVWVAYESAGNGIDLFVDSSEIKTLRYATGHGMKVAFWPFGLTFTEALQKAPTK